MLPGALDEPRGWRTTGLRGPGQGACTMVQSENYGSQGCVDNPENRHKGGRTASFLLLHHPGDPQDVWPVGLALGTWR